MMRAGLALLVLAACQTLPPTPQAPYLLVLGSAQDGGLPQIGCREAVCERARIDENLRRRVTSLALVDPRDGRRWLFDASPDLAEQVELVERVAPRTHRATSRPPLFDGVFLTHAHVGHYAGLAQLGREIYGARELPVWCSERMGAFLRSNGPWSLLVDTRAIELCRIAPRAPVELGPGLSVDALRVPHRDEFSDTLAFVVRGPGRSVAYLPDIDKWERWDVPLEDFLASVDLALVDGTFFADGEVPGRSMAEIPHPFISETLARLSAAPLELRRKVVFTHLNHTNPAADPRSDAARAIRASGMRVARDGEVLALGED
ncbi:MAG: pyrroloquinoline quinone biosynthesis protein PqqB [Planctomycetes bacterium]|nr:pyrroloquinoline quinone biosynthesis protein PqqB [Planctomycetota bacterium]